MKISPWLMGGAGALFVVGLVGLALGVLLPGGLEPVEAPGGSGKSAVADFKQKAALSTAALVQKSGRKEMAAEEWQGHRVFVSRSIVFLPQEKEPVQPLNEKQVTDDGIEVGWKLNMGFLLKIVRWRIRMRIRTDLQIRRSTTRRPIRKIQRVALLNGSR